jgi:hypothetical protein
MKEVERRRRIASVVADTESPIIVPGVQDEDRADHESGRQARSAPW